MVAAENVVRLLYKNCRGEIRRERIGAQREADGGSPSLALVQPFSKAAGVSDIAMDACLAATLVTEFRGDHRIPANA